MVSIPFLLTYISSVDQFIIMSVIETDWDFIRNNDDIENRSFLVYETKIFSVLYELENAFKSQTYFTNNINSTENQDNELKALVEKNKELRQEIDEKSQEFAQKMSLYKKLKKDQNSLSEEIKKTHEAFVMAKKYYKKYLKIYYTIESKNDKSQTIFVQFFTEAKKDVSSYSLRLLRNTSTGGYEVLSTLPNLSSIKELQRKLRESNDVPGVVCCIRQAFKDLKKN